MIHLKRRFKIGFPAATIWLAVVSWAGLVGLVILTDPEIFANYRYLPIWPMMFLSLAATLRLILGSWRRGLIFALAGMAYMVFRYLGIGHILYLILLVGISMSVLVIFPLASR